MPTEYIYVLCMYFRKKQRPIPYRILTECFFITKEESVYCAVRTGPLNKADYASEQKD